MFIAENFFQFKSLFTTRLKQMLTDSELGAFILVLANSQQDAGLKSELNQDIQKSFDALREGFSSVKKHSTQDDIDVFEKLATLKIQDIVEWQYKKVGRWELAYNSMRQLRPARAAKLSFESIKMNFDEANFHFNKPFLKPEILWEGDYLGKKLRVLYNKFPFSDYHLLIAVSPEINSPQLLTKKAHQLIFSLTQDSVKKFPGFGVGFNSLAAGASVNHLHFQGFIREDSFPIEDGYWQHNGGSEKFPLNVSVFNTAESSWKYIEQLTENNVAYNCLYREDRCYVVPRKFQGTVDLPGWLEGAGWLDVAGVITVSDEEMFQMLDEQSVTQALSLLSID